MGAWTTNAAQVKHWPPELILEVSKSTTEHPRGSNEDKQLHAARIQSGSAFRASFALKKWLKGDLIADSGAIKLGIDDKRVLEIVADEGLDVVEDETMDER